MTTARSHMLSFLEQAGVLPSDKRMRVAPRFERVAGNPVDILTRGGFPVDVVLAAAAAAYKIDVAGTNLVDLARTRMIPYPTREACLGVTVVDRNNRRVTLFENPERAQEERQKPSFQGHVALLAPGSLELFLRNQNDTAATSRGRSSHSADSFSNAATKMKHVEENTLAIPLPSVIASNPNEGPFTNRYDGANDVDDQRTAMTALPSEIAAEEREWAKTGDANTRALSRESLLHAARSSQNSDPPTRPVFVADLPHMAGRGGNLVSADDDDGARTLQISADEARRASSVQASVFSDVSTGNRRDVAATALVPLPAVPSLISLSDPGNRAVDVQSIDDDDELEERSRRTMKMVEAASHSDLSGDDLSIEDRTQRVANVADFSRQDVPLEVPSSSRKVTQTHALAEDATLPSMNAQRKERSAVSKVMRDTGVFSSNATDLPSISGSQIQSVSESASGDVSQTALVPHPHAWSSDDGKHVDGKRRSLSDEAHERTLLLPNRVEADDLLERIGRYRRLRVIGHGGMATVFLCTDDTGHEVAVKILDPELVADEVQLERFRREAKALRALNHPNVVRVVDSGADNGVDFIVTEYADGGTLGDLLKTSHRLPAAIVAIVLDEVLSGLAHAHDHGIVHRDLKPGNILFGKSGNIRIADFGIAKIQADVSITQAGTLFGTPAYMSPEQASGGDVDHRADLFSLGTLAYEMLSGENPFRHEQAATSVFRLASGDFAPLVELCPEVPWLLDEVITRMMSVDANNRYPNAATAQQALAPLVDAVRVKHPELLRALVEEPYETIANVVDGQVQADALLGTELMALTPPRVREAALAFFRAQVLDPTDVVSRTAIEHLHETYGIVFREPPDPRLETILKNLERHRYDADLIRSRWALEDAHRNMVGLACSVRRYLRLRPNDEDARLMSTELFGKNPIAPYAPGYGTLGMEPMMTSTFVEGTTEQIGAFERASVWPTERDLVENGDSLSVALGLVGRVVVEIFRVSKERRQIALGRRLAQHWSTATRMLAEMQTTRFHDGFMGRLKLHVRLAAASAFLVVVSGAALARALTVLLRS